MQVNMKITALELKNQMATIFKKVASGEVIEIEHGHYRNVVFELKVKDKGK